MARRVRSIIVIIGIVLVLNLDIFLFFTTGKDFIWRGIKGFFELPAPIAAVIFALVGIVMLTGAVIRRKRV